MGGSVIHMRIPQCAVGELSLFDFHVMGPETNLDDVSLH